MKCEDIVRLAPLYVSGELDEKQAKEFDAHLRTCPACMLELERQSRLDARLRQVVLAEQTDVSEVDRRVREMIAAEAEGRFPPAARPGRKRWANGLMGAAAALVLAAVGYRVFLGTQVARVYAEAARDHRAEVVEQQPRQWVTDPVQIASLAQQQGIPSSAIAALSSGAYHLSRGRLCFLDGRIFLHLVYSAGGWEFSAYLRMSDAKALPGRVREVANGKPLSTADADHEHLASVSTSQLVALVVSDESSEAALGFARFASSVL